MRTRGRERERKRDGGRRQRLVDEDLKETGNGFTFTTHFALGLTFGRGSRCVALARSAAVTAAIHGARR